MLQISEVPIWKIFAPSCLQH